MKTVRFLVLLLCCSVIAVDKGQASEASAAEMAEDILNWTLQNGRMLSDERLGHRSYILPLGKGEVGIFAYPERQFQQKSLVIILVPDRAHKFRFTFLVDYDVDGTEDGQGRNLLYVDTLSCLAAVLLEKTTCTESNSAWSLFNK